jgi:hypothetical protein
MANYNPNTHSLSMGVSTRNVLRPGEWFSELQNLARYPTCEIIMDGGITKEWPGTKFTWRIADDPGIPKGPTAPYQTFTADNQSKLIQAEMPIRHGIETNGIDQWEIAANSGEAKLVDEVELGMQMMYQRTCDKLELNSWSVPAAGDTQLEFGIPGYVTCPSNASGGFKFQGGVPAGYSLVANIDPVTANPRYRNYANLYTDYTHQDFSVKVSEMFRAIDFHAIPKGKSMEGGGIDALRAYCGDDSLTDYELLLNTQNDQLGRDGVPMFRKGLLAGMQIHAVPQLNSDGTGTPASNSQPWYFINHRLLFPVFTPGFRFKETTGKVPMSYQDFWAVRWSYNWVCYSRRRQGVLAKSAPFGEGVAPA